MPQLKFWEMISPDERVRHARFYFERDKNAFLIARGTLRQLLGNYIGVKPEAICFAYNEWGKPSLSESIATGLKFNIAHSEGIALFAFSAGRELGVDVEFHRDNIDFDELANSVFSERERSAFLALPQNQKKTAFFAIWTRKEAYIKARGKGLAIPLESFDVSQDLENAEIFEVRDLEGDKDRWALQNLEVAYQYSGAIIVEGKNWKIRRL